VPEDGDASRTRQRLLEDLDLLLGQLGDLVAQARRVASGPGDTGNQPGLDGIRHHSPDDGDCGSGLLRGSRRTYAMGHDHVDLEEDEFGREIGEPLGPPVSPSLLDDDVLALDVPELAQPVPKRLEVDRESLRSWCVAEVPDAPHLFRGLRFSGERRRDGTTQGRQQEAAAVHPAMVGQAPVRSQRRESGGRLLGVADCGR
jgi:hypothetical protein